MLVEFGKYFLIEGIFFKKLEATNYFRIEKISYFGNYMDPWFYAFVLFWNNGIVIDSSVRSHERTTNPQEQLPALILYS